MNILEKLFTALRGGINETGEKMVDKQALRILEQELRDATEELSRAKRSLVDIIAHQKTTEAKKQAIDEKISEYENYAIQALDKENEELAREVALKIVVLETQQAEQAALAEKYRESAETLRQSVHETEERLRHMQQQAEAVKTTESVQQAQKLAAERFTGSDSKLRSAMESLERIQERQTHEAAKLKAASELSSSNQDISLDEKLQKAGIKPTDNKAEQILARLKSKKHPDLEK